MTNFLPVGDNKFSEFLAKYETVLIQEFFDEIYPEAIYHKPSYIRNNGVQLYEHVIKGISLKLTKSLLDHNEKRILKWDLEKKYRFRVREDNIDLNNRIPTWNLLLDTFEDFIEQIFFNIAEPKATISYHYGVSSHCYRVHWCLQENEGFIFDIEGERKKWKTGLKNIFMFDDGKVNHGVIFEGSNNTQPRIVAIFDIKKEFWDEK